MTTHEIILFWSSFMVSGDAFVCVWFRVLPLLHLLEIFGTPHLRLEACLNTANLSWGPLVTGCGTWGWDDELPYLGLAPRVGVIDSHASVWPLGLG